MGTSPQSLYSACILLYSVYIRECTDLKNRVFIYIIFRLLSVMNNVSRNNANECCSSIINITLSKYMSTGYRIGVSNYALFSLSCSLFYSF